MYQFSRSIYRELAPRVVEDPSDVTGCGSKQQVLDACESTMHRLATDRRYFARPTRSLFTQIRSHFSINDQLLVFTVVERYVSLAIEHVELLAAEGMLGGPPPECQAHTRRGTPCQRQPLPGRDYCPSHKHLEEVFEIPQEIDLDRGASKIEGIGAAA